MNTHTHKVGERERKIYIRISRFDASLKRTAKKDLRGNAKDEHSIRGRGCCWHCRRRHCADGRWCRREAIGVRDGIVAMEIEQAYALCDRQGDVDLIHQALFDHEREEIGGFRSKVNDKMREMIDGHLKHGNVS